MVQNPPACPTIAFPIARQWLYHGRAVSFLLSYSNCDICADSPFVGIPLWRRDKRPFWSVLRLFSPRFSPFEKTADFSPKSTFSASRRRYSPFFSWIGSHGCQEKTHQNLLCGRTEKDFEGGEKIVSNLKLEIWDAKSGLLQIEFRAKIRTIGYTTRFPNDNKNNRKK